MLSSFYFKLLCDALLEQSKTTNNTVLGICSKLQNYNKKYSLANFQYPIFNFLDLKGGEEFWEGRNLGSLGVFGSFWEFLGVWEFLEFRSVGVLGSLGVWEFRSVGV
ncbi:MAG: hypothetical protein IKI36_02800 [Prevotella sp.]|nr:hypothetical protein [Prevotella sp.]